MGTNPSFDPSLFNSGVSQAQWAEWTQDKRTPLINRAIAGVYAPGSTFKMAVAMAGAGGAQHHAGRRGPLPRLSRPRRRAVPLLAQGRPRLARPARRPEEQLRRVLLRDGAGAPASTASRRWRTASVSGTELEIDLPGARPGLIPTREWRIGQGHPWNLGDTVVCRHRPGLHPGHAAAARHLCRARRHRPQGGAASDAQARRRAAARIAAGGLAQPRPVRAFAARGARGHVGGGERAGRHRAAGEAARSSAGRWPARPVRRRCAACRASSASRATSTAPSCPGSSARTRCSSPTRRTTRRATRCRWWWSTATPAPRRPAPIARDIMIDVLQRDPGRTRRTARRAGRRARWRRDEGRPPVARDLVRPRRQDLADQLALRAAALRAGRRRLRRAVQRRRRCAGAVRRRAMCCGSPPAWC